MRKENPFFLVCENKLRQIMLSEVVRLQYGGWKMPILTSGWERKGQRRMLLHWNLITWLPTALHMNVLRRMANFTKNSSELKKHIITKNIRSLFARSTIFLATKIRSCYLLSPKNHPSPVQRRKSWFLSINAWVIKSDRKPPDFLPLPFNWSEKRSAKKKIGKTFSSKFVSLKF